MSEMTDAQRRIYDFVVRQCHDGTPPTIREVMDFMGFSSPNAVAGHVRALRKKGYLDASENKARSIRPTDNELVVTRFGDSVIVSTTGPVSFTFAEWKEWIRENRLSKIR